MSDAETEKRPAFKPGDVVCLLGSNFSMTVEDVIGERVHCVWAHDGAIRRDEFMPVVLGNITASKDAHIEAMREQMRSARAASQQSAQTARYLLWR